MVCNGRTGLKQGDKLDKLQWEIQKRSKRFVSWIDQLEVGPKHRLLMQRTVGDHGVDMQEQSGKAPREVRQKSVWHGSKIPLDIIW
jgi:hypothetical protein